MNTTALLVLLFALQGICILLGRRAARNLKSSEGYFLSDRSVRIFPLMMTFLAAQVGGGFILGASEASYGSGWTVLLYPLGAALGLIGLGLGIGRKLAAFQVTTVAEILEVVYRSNTLRRIAGALSSISLFMVLIAQILASRKFLIGIGCESVLVLGALWLLVIVYTSQGGLKAVIATDLLQASFFIITFLIAVGWILFSQPDVLSTASQVANAPLDLPLASGWLLMPLLFMAIEQDMGQRCFAANSPKTVSKATLLAGIALFTICAIPIFLGALAKAYGIEIPAGGSVLMASIMQSTNPWISTLVGCAVLAAIINTANSLMNTITSNIANDLLFGALKERLTIPMIRKISAIFASLAFVFSFFADSVLGILIQTYELSVSTLFVPLILSLFKKRGHFLSALLAIIMGGTGFCLFRIFPTDLPKEPLSILLALAGYGVGELLSHIQLRKLKEKML